ncbi:hypothetical protein [Actinoplanes sp. NPDC051851]|uniref:hypothetical protein n=1 Tax=Actinoplanes sp. NPDC051851 TaxID=3154753 RepID=UPI0034359A85
MPALVDRPGSGVSTPEEVVRAMQDWLPRWEAWAHDRRGAQATDELFAQFQSFVSKARKEDDELVLGVGLVSAFAGGTWSLRQYVLVGEVEVETDADRHVTSLRLVDGLHRADEDAFDVNDGYLADPRAEAFDGWQRLDPLSEQTAGWLRGWREGHWRTPPRWDPIAEPPEPPDDERVQLTLSPALFRRSRESNGVAAFYEKIGQSLSGPGARVPLGFAQLLHPLDADQRAAWLGSTAAPAISADLLRWSP